MSNPITIEAIEKLINRGDYVNIAPDGTVTIAPHGGLKDQLETLRADFDECASELSKLTTLLDTPEVEDFDKAVPREAAHQVKRWKAEHDAGKNPEDWFWLVGYLAGKALAAMKAGDITKAKHHTISTAAALRNWHAHIRTRQSDMRPGISAEKQSIAEPSHAS